MFYDSGFWFNARDFVLPILDVICLLNDFKLSLNDFRFNGNNYKLMIKSFKEVSYLMV